MEPSDNARLGEFIAAAKARDVGDEFIVALLKQNGWSERRIYGAFSIYYEGVIGTPTPTRGARVEYASDAFLYLLAFSSLGSWAFAVGAVFYTLIDRWVPNGLDTTYELSSFRDSVSWELATIIVAFPIFAFVSRIIAKGLHDSPERAESGVRKWLTYVALVVTALALVGDGIWFLNAFLTGNLTARFVLQTVVLIALAGGIFTYYLLAVRGAAFAVARDRGFAALAGGLALLALALGFSNVGTPAYARQLAEDRRRVDDLTAMKTEIALLYGERRRPLPATSAGFPADVVRKDPQNALPYEYRRLDAGRYRLCAAFEAVASPEPIAFAHGAGRSCFDLDANAPR